MSEIKLGDIVTLKSDTSVKMTVGDTDNMGLAVCYYFLNSEIRLFSISKSALLKVETTDALLPPIQ